MVSENTTSLSAYTVISRPEELLQTQMELELWTYDIDRDQYIMFLGINWV